MYIDDLDYPSINTEERENSNNIFTNDFFQAHNQLFFGKDFDEELTIIVQPDSKNSTGDTLNPLPFCINNLALPDEYEQGNESKQLFEVFNCGKTPGRIPENKKSEIQKIISKKIPFYTVHTNKDFDNILRKIKVQFHKFLLGFVKLLLKKEFPNEYRNLVIKKIHAKVTQNVTIEFNKKQLKSSLYEFLTQEISPKYKQSTQNSNALNLQYAMLRNRKVCKILKMTYKDFYTDFFLITNNNCLDFYDECINLPKILDRLDNQNNYRNDFEKIARESLLAHFQSNKSRKRKPNKKKNISSKQYSN